MIGRSLWAKTSSNIWRAPSHAVFLNRAISLTECSTDFLRIRNALSELCLSAECRDSRSQARVLQLSSRLSFQSQTPYGSQLPLHTSANDSPPWGVQATDSRCLFWFRCCWLKGAGTKIFMVFSTAGVQRALDQLVFTPKRLMTEKWKRESRAVYGVFQANTFTPQWRQRRNHYRQLKWDTPSLHHHHSYNTGNIMCYRLLMFLKYHIICAVLRGRRLCCVYRRGAEETAWGDQCGDTEAGAGERALQEAGSGAKDERRAEGQVSSELKLAHRLRIECITICMKSKVSDHIAHKNKAQRLIASSNGLLIVIASHAEGGKKAYIRC